MERVEEYNAIRQEILLHYNHIKDYRNLAYTVAIATLAFSFTDSVSGEPFIGLLPIMVIIPLFLACERSYLAISKMGAYIRVFFYDDGFHWENRGPYFHKILGHYEKGGRKHYFEQEVLFIDIIVMCSIITIYRVLTSSVSRTEIIVRSAIVIVLLIASIAFILFIRKFTGMQREDYDKTWERIRGREKKKGKPLR